MTRVFVTGGTGYVGRRLVRALLEHLVGTPHPLPSKAAEFRRVDLLSILASVAAARHAGAAHVVYVSVAQPAPVMHAYIAVRADGEAALAASGLTATVLRPWYVLRPGHWWPLALMPLYSVARLVPSLRAVERPPAPGRLALVDVPGIHGAGAR